MADEGQPSNPPAAPNRRGSGSSAVNVSAASQTSSHQVYGSDAPPKRRPQLSKTQTREYGSITRPALDQSESSRPKHAMSRRTPSMQKPHKGQEFSVDDAENEVEEDQALQRQARHATGTLRRQPSTLRRRVTTHPVLPRVDSEPGEEEQEHTGTPSDADLQTSSFIDDGTLQADESSPEEEEEEEVEEEDDLSDAESFTLKDRQKAINETHPFGIRIWKPALYKKSRSVQKTAEEEIHSTPGGNVSSWLLFFNFLWTFLFGFWLAILAGAGGLVCLFLGFFDSGCFEYGKVLWGLSGYLLYPFGKYVKLVQEEAYAEEDQGEGRSISEYEQWQSGDIEEGRLFFGPVNINRSLIGRRRNSVDSADETQSLLGRGGRDSAEPVEGRPRRRRLFGRGQWNLGRVIFFIFFYGLITPCLFLVSFICWLFVFSIPMGKVTLLLFYHLRRHPLALSFHNDSHSSRDPSTPSAAILVCTYRAVGLRYWKYTIDGTNIFLINLLSIVAFVIFDYWILDVALEIKSPFTSPGFIFTLAIFSIIPLAYFIGQAVASISAQSSMGVGATVNAFFSTVVEVFLYCVALKQGKAQLVEGSVIGSIFAGVLFLPGISMCFGALRRKTQRFNVKSAGVTSTMLLFAVICAFGPTLFYQIYGSHELNCSQCVDDSGPSKDVRDCRRCYFDQAPAINDRFYQDAVRPFSYMSAFLLFLSYVIGLMFTLRTHAAVIWSTELDEKKPEKLENSSHLSHSGVLSGSQDSGHAAVPLFGTHAGKSQILSRSEIRESQLYKRILGQSLKQVGLSPHGTVIDTEDGKPNETGENQLPYLVPPKNREDESRPNSRAQASLRLATLTEEENHNLVLQVAEMAATAATVAARDATRAPQKASRMAVTPVRLHSHVERPPVQRNATFAEDGEVVTNGETVPVAGGHDAPNWSRTKSTIILLTATVAYAVIAEVLVDTVDSVLEHVDIDEKFLGITLFALVPNTTEFLNAISFAMNGNIALSMEIGSAYALQVCLLQIPALVLFSAIHGRFIDASNVIDHTFTLIFPQWDMVTVILCVFLLSYMYGEGKSNYFKGSILILSYLVVVIGFYFSGFDNEHIKGVNRYDTLAIGERTDTLKFKTVGFGKRSGLAYGV